MRAKYCCWIQERSDQGDRHLSGVESLRSKIESCHRSGAKGSLLIKHFDLLAANKQAKSRYLKEVYYISLLASPRYNQGNDKNDENEEKDAQEKIVTPTGALGSRSYRAACCVLAVGSQV